jgi:hypothetical protein
MIYFASMKESLLGGFEGVRVTGPRPDPDVDFEGGEIESIHSGTPLDADPNDPDSAPLEVGRLVPLSGDLSDKLRAYDPLIGRGDQPPQNPQE